MLAWIAYYKNRRFKEDSDRYQRAQDTINEKQAEQFFRITKIN